MSFPCASFFLGVITRFGCFSWNFPGGNAIVILNFYCLLKKINSRVFVIKIPVFMQLYTTDVSNSLAMTFHKALLR